MKLEIKHIAPYLPFQLKAIDDHGRKLIVDWDCQTYTNTIVGLNHVLKTDDVQFNSFKPLLKSLTKLSDEELIPVGLLIRDIENATYKDKIFAIEDATSWLIKKGMRPVLSLNQTQRIMEYLFSIHADVFNLIENDLAKEIS